MPSGWQEAETIPEEAAPESISVVPLPLPKGAQPPAKAQASPAPPSSQAASPKPAASSQVVPSAPQTPAPAASEAPPDTPEPESSDEPDEPDVLLTPEAPLTLAQRLEDPNSYTFNNSVKAAEVATSDYMDWYFKTLDQVGSTLASGTPNLTPLRIPYLSTTCLDPAPAEGRLGVVVDDKGAVSQPPYVLSSTGYSILDEQAQAVILANEYTFPPSGSTTAYGLPVLVEYDAASCVPPEK
ncbi:MAG TPA: hypothetical protein V6D06_11145 [Trichocoleus sp.]